MQKRTEIMLERTDWDMKNYDKEDNTIFYRPYFVEEDNFYVSDEALEELIRNLPETDEEWAEVINKFPNDNFKE